MALYSPQAEPATSLAMKEYILALYILVPRQPKAVL